MKEPCKLQIGGSHEDGRQIGMLITDADGVERFFLGHCIYSGLSNADVEAIQDVVIGGLLEMKNPDPGTGNVSTPGKPGGK